MMPCSACVQVQADAQQWAEVPLTTSVVPRPWPKSRREVAPNAFRITVPEGSLAELALPVPARALFGARGRDALRAFRFCFAMMRSVSAASAADGSC